MRTKASVLTALSLVVLATGAQAADVQIDAQDRTGAAAFTDLHDGRWPLLVPGGRDLVPYWSSSPLPTPLGECAATTVRNATPSNWTSVIGSATGCDRVVLAAGDYGAGTVALNPRGTGVSAPLTIEPAAGATVNINAALYMTATRYVRWNGVPGALRFQASSSDYLATVQTASSSFVEFRSAIFDMGADAGGRIHGLLVKSGAANVYVLGNVFRNNESLAPVDHAVYTGDTARMVVANNVLYDVRGGYGLHIWGKTQDGWFVHNTVDQTGECSGTAGSSTTAHADGFPAARNTVEANVFSRPGSRGGCESPWKSFWSGHSPPSGPEANQLNWNVSTDPVGGLAGVVQSGNTWGVVPGFVDEANRDYHLTAGSAARNEGLRKLVDVDFDGRVRDTARPDAGAFEF